MTTALAMPDDEQPPATTAAAAAPGPFSLLTWAREAREAYQIATSLAETTFVPKALAHKPGEVTGAILMGVELQMKPMAALRSIDIIEGTPSIRANAMRGLAQQHGHQIWVEESTPSRATVCGRRRGTEHVERVTWTIDRARAAGLTGKKVWREYPADMLLARATAGVCRLVAADVLLGVPYAVEELGEPPAPHTVGPAAAGTVESGGPEPERRALQRKPVPAAPPPAPAKPEPAPATEPKLTDPQRRRLMALCSARFGDDRQRRLDAAAAIVGHAVESYSGLTRHEAAKLIDTFEDPGWASDAEPEPADDWPPVAAPPPGHDGEPA